MRGCQIGQLGSAAAMGEGVWKCKPNLSAAAQKKIERDLARTIKNHVCRGFAIVVRPRSKKISRRFAPR